MTTSTGSLAVDRLLEARRRTLALTDVPDLDLTTQHSPLMSPLVWDLAHIGMQEEFFLLRGVGGAAPMLAPDVEQLYDAFRHPRAGRVALPLLAPGAARSYDERVRDLTVQLLLDRPDETTAFTASLVAQHEQQHIETMLATHQLRQGPPLLKSRHARPSNRRLRGTDTVTVAGGPCVIGVDAGTEPDALDNEIGAHVVDVAAFRIGRVPVTNGEWSEFVADRGYDQRSLWSPEGWLHRLEAGLSGPLFWTGAGTRVRFGVVENVPADEPVQHISYWEAEAFARWAGGRLPTELEWEKACAWDPGAGARRRWPWGNADPDGSVANLGGTALRPAAAGSLPAGASAYGVEQTIGDVWEWTSSELSPWPGFRPMVYDTYSAPFFGPGYRVLRGGSWATGTPAVRPSFRNWDLPQRRQIFTGVRLAWDA